MNKQVPVFPTSEALIELIKNRSYREGDFTLVSGKKSSFYIDMKATTLSPQGAWLIGHLAFEALEKLDFEGVGGLTLGADPIATAVSLIAYEKGHLWPAFIVRKEPKNHGTSQYVEGTENLKPGARVVVLEDVVTTGGSGVKAVERLRASGFNPIAILTVVDREEGGEKIFRDMGLPLITLVTLSQLRK